MQPELQARGIRYMPMVWSSYGREHPEASNTLQLLARTAARRRGLCDWRPLLARMRRSVAIQLQRRLVAQLHACLRCLPSESEDVQATEADVSHCTREPDDDKPAARTIGEPVLGPAGLLPEAGGELIRETELATGTTGEARNPNEEGGPPPPLPSPLHF